MKLTQIAFLLVASACLTAPARAERSSTPTIKIDSAWLRATPKGAPVIGGYASITNTGPAPDRLIGAKVPVAAPAEIHSMSMKDGVMHMEQLKQGLAIAPGATVALTPSTYHLMFFKPTEQIKEGQTIEGALVFERAGTVPVSFAVGGMGAKAAPGDADMKGMHGMAH